ncbi:MAG: aspartyl protease family protein, partial [Saprospiraceae bacterium]
FTFPIEEFGEKGNFIFDTGSERLVLNQQYFKTNATDKTVVSAGNTGLVAFATEMMIDTLLIDQLFIPDLKAHVIDLSHIELKKNTRIIGILGFDVFEEFEVFIDFQNSRIMLSRLDKNGIRMDSIRNYEMPNDSLRFELNRHVISVIATLNNVKLNLMLDSGAELNLIDRKVSRHVLDSFTVIKRVNLIGMGKKQVEVLAGSLRGLKVGNEKCSSMNTLLTSLDDINRNFGLSLDGVLGYEFLSTRRVLINYKKRKLYFFNPQRS